MPPGLLRAPTVSTAEYESGRENPPQDVSAAKLKTSLELLWGYLPLRFAIRTSSSVYAFTVRNIGPIWRSFVESADSAPAVVTPRDDLSTRRAHRPGNYNDSRNQPSLCLHLRRAIVGDDPESRSGRSSLPGDRRSTQRCVSMKLLPSRKAFRDISVLPEKRYYYRVSANWTAQATKAPKFGSSGGLFLE